MQTPRRSVLTGQPQPAAKPQPPQNRPEPSPHGPLVLLGLAVLVLLGTFGLLAVWRAQPGVLPFVPRTATPTPTISVLSTTLPETVPQSTPTIAPIPNPGGKDVTQELESIEMMAGGYGWGRGRHSLWRTSDGGQTWLDVTPPLAQPAAVSRAAIRQVFFLSRRSAWFLLPGEGASTVGYATHNGGQSWHSAPVPFGPAAVLYFVDDINGWAWDDETLSLYRSDDGGQTWGQMAVSGLPQSATQPLNGALTFLDNRHGWLTLAGSPVGLYQTSDGGQTWAQRELPLPPGLDWAGWSPLAAPRFFDDNLAPGVLPARAVERRSRREVHVFFLTSDGGRSWQAAQPVAAGVSYSLPSVERMYVVDARGVLQRSLRAGNFWQTGGSFRDMFGSGLAIRPQGIDFVNSEQGWAWQVFDGQFLLFATTDAGESWRRLDYTSQDVQASAQAAARLDPQLVSAPAAHSGNAAACRWQAVDFNLPLLPLNAAGSDQDWMLYLNPAHRFSFKVPPNWSLAEINYTCPGRERDVHRLVLMPPDVQDSALLTIAFRHPGQDIPLRDPAAQPPAGLQEQGTAAFFWRKVVRAVLPGENGLARYPSAIYYDAGQEIALGSEYVFTAVLESNRPDSQDAGLAPETVQQAEQMLASFEPLRADGVLLSTMDVQSTFTSSPDGAWEVETLVAQPLERSPIGYDYQRVTVTNQAEDKRWVALDHWTRHSRGETIPTGFVWSRDGRWLYLYNSGITDICPLFTHHNGLRRLDLASGQVEDLNLYPDSTLANLDISPDGERVAYLPPDYLTNPRIILRSLLEGGDQEIADQEIGDQEIAFNDPLIDHWGAGGIRWAPDGQRLVFAIAGPYCEQQEENRIVVLVDPAAGQTRALTARDRWLTINKWLPDGRLRLADSSANLFILDVDSGELASIPPDPPDQLAEAESYLRGYFMMLHNTWFDPGTYQWAVAHYGGSYDELLRLNPSVDPFDKAALFQNACEQNGYYCLRMRRVTERELIPGDGSSLLFRFTVEFLNSDGSLFKLRERSTFDFTVSRQPDGIYRILDLPPR